LIVEPATRNTAAVAVAAAAIGAASDADALILLAPSDHAIGDLAAFHRALSRAAQWARERIVTFGIEPDRPATGYGYIKRGAQLDEGVFAIDGFEEKPDAETAQRYLDAGDAYWNSGIFLFHAATLLGEFGAHPSIRDAALRAVDEATREDCVVRLGPAYADAPALPLDVAVMEHTSRGVVASCDMGWADIGSWDEVWRLAPKDERGNAVVGEVRAMDAQGNLLRGDGVRIAVSGVSDLIVIATPETVIVVPRERAQDVKALRELALRSSGDSRSD
jgi:mannose-1-phosphate guanylyltransferase/mannose-6-phosphate isomerase